MYPLQENLAKVDRDTVVRDTVRLIDEEVQRKSGLSGMALKSGYKVVKKLQNGQMIRDAVDHLLDEFTEALAPLHQEYLEQEELTRFDDYLVANGKSASDALLAITDGRAARSDNKILKSTYQKLRGQAEKHVIEALPGVGRLIERHVPRTETA